MPARSIASGGGVVGHGARSTEQGVESGDSVHRCEQRRWQLTSGQRQVAAATEAGAPCVNSRLDEAHPTLANLLSCGASDMQRANLVLDAADGAAAAAARAGEAVAMNWQPCCIEIEPSS